MARKLDVTIFPGQGAQFRGMGRGLFEEFKDLTRRADEVLGYSIEVLCLEDKERRLNLTQYTQPALYFVNVLHYFKAQKEGASKPDVLLGHSLGEYCALFAADAFDFETGLRLVQHRGALMGQATGGGMAAVVNLPVARVTALLGDRDAGGVEVANFNAPTQVVLAGPSEALKALAPVLEREGATVLPLPVSAAFHSRYMRPAMEAFERFLQDVPLREPSIPVISNLHARPYRPGEIRQNLVRQICSPVRWVESIWYLLSQGEPSILEVGPKKTLTKLVDQSLAAGLPPSFDATQVDALTDARS
ncbi:ACP S-malonyltransferase [Corallococcus sp. BB11-1]|uniref:ACP S-malonyltransferase n=1 Tax=Corallococcus sp. BB11-1 TaxID=2996783 RepID=UPI002271933A|nr:ACP S-malonyltransferase [Corallococcus sp. BB11-1]MCY1033276.1 ACP S-malonyltransferase [Corallococcus sp. BB11-1]